MRRRTFVTAGLGAVSMPLLAGCSSTDPGDATESPETASGEDLPDGVYVQQFFEGMSMQGTAEAGELRVAVMFTSPHQFWRVLGDELSETAIEEPDSAHLMATAWDPETGTVIPETGLSVEVAPADGTFEEGVIYPMLSQQMGFHYGANFSLSGDGTYAVKVSVGGVNIRRTGGFEGRFDEFAEGTVDMEFTDESRGDIEVRELDSYGQRGAVEPMGMMMPDGVTPPVEEMPGEHLGTEQSDDAMLPAFVVRDIPPVGDDAYLYVSARTPYNEYVLPGGEFEMQVERDGETVAEGTLERTLDPDLKYHYGAALDSLESGDEVTVTPITPPQVARHEGYERAFLEMDAVTYTV